MKALKLRVMKLEAAIAAHQELASRPSSVEGFDWERYQAVFKEFTEANPRDWLELLREGHRTTNQPA